MSTNPLHKKIMDLVAPMFKEYVQPTKGVVLAYSNKTHYAKVEIDDPYGTGTMILPRVPVVLNEGVHSPGPKKGDEVWINFTGGKITMPMIVARADRNYEKATREKKLQHKKKGAYVPDTLSKR